jgi:hypothetical protein
MAINLNCEKCRKTTEGKLDTQNNNVYCDLCGEVITGATHFTKVQLRTLGQVKKPAKNAYSIRCDKCKKECLPALKNNILICGWCGQDCKNVSKPFELLVRAEIKKGPQEL